MLNLADPRFLQRGLRIAQGFKLTSSTVSLQLLSKPNKRLCIRAAGKPCFPVRLKETSLVWYLREQFTRPHLQLTLREQIQPHLPTLSHPPSDYGSPN